MNAKKKPAPILLIIWFLSLAIAFVVGAETILRIKGVRPWKVEPDDITVEPGGRFFQKHPVLGYSPLPGRFKVILKKQFEFNVTHLPDGLRITHPLKTYPGSAERPQIWMFGCSYTYGWSLNDEETYPWLLQERFPEYEVVNFGVPGYGTIQSLLQFKSALEDATPQIAILAYASFQDERNTYIRDRRKTTARWNKLGPLVQPYARLDNEGKLRYLEANLGYQEFPLMRQSALIHYFEILYNKLERRWAQCDAVTLKLILEMAEMANKANVVFIVAGISEHPDTREMLSVLHNQGVQTVDIAMDLSRPGYTNFPYDTHPSALAHVEFADKLEKYLKERFLGGS